jgi:hypothetical protein
MAVAIPFLLSTAAMYVYAGIAIYATVNYLAKQAMQGQGATQQSGIDGITISNKDPAANRNLVYGECRIGGTLVYSNTSGTDNERLYQVYALSYDNDEVLGTKIPALHRCIAVYADGDVGAYRPAQQYGVDLQWVYTARFHGNLTLTSDYVDLTFRDGSQSNVDSLLDWNSTNILRGIAYVGIELKYDREKWQNGMPNLSFVVQGRRVYDPRVTAQNSNDPRTWEYSSNPALCLADYLRNESFGLATPFDRINEAALIAAANICDESVALNGGGTHARYSCDGLVQTKNKIVSNVEDILSSMAGKLFYSAGQYYIVAGSDRDAETTVIDENMMVGEVKLVTKKSKRDQFNSVKAKFRNAQRQYRVESIKPQTNSGYVADDGGEIQEINIEMPFTTSNQRAQRLAKIALETSRLQATINLKLSLEAMQYKVGDIVKVSFAKFGYVEKTFEIQNLKIVPDADAGVTVDVTATETKDDTHDWSAGDAVVNSTLVNTNMYDGTVVSAPQSVNAEFSVVSDDDGVRTPKLNLTIIDEPSVYVVEYLVLIYRIPYNGVSGHSQYRIDSQEFRLERDFALRSSHMIDVVDRRAGAYRISVQAINTLGVVSDRTTEDFGISKAQRREILNLQSNEVIVVRTTDPLDGNKPTVEEIEFAKGAPVEEYDEILHQQVNSVGAVIDARVYFHNSDVRLLNKMSTFFSYVEATQTDEKAFVDFWVEVNSGETGTWSVYALPFVSGGGRIDPQGHCSWTIYDTEAEINALKGDDRDGQDIYSDDYLDYQKVRMSGSSRQRALFRFEIDSDTYDELRATGGAGAQAVIAYYTREYYFRYTLTNGDIINIDSRIYPYLYIKVIPN